jgi:hypothetical protein
MGAWKMILGFRAFFAKKGKKKKIRVEVPETFAKRAEEQRSILMLEASRHKEGRYTAYRHQPHFGGDEYHGHADISGGYEVSWGVSGRRRHPSKFPGNVPNDARIAVAKVLNVDPNLLEGYEMFDETVGGDVLLLELIEATKQDKE